MKRKEKMKERLLNVILFLILLDLVLLSNDRGTLLYYVIVISILIILCLLFKLVGGLDEE